MKSFHISRISIAVLGAMVAFNAGAVTLSEMVTGGTVNGDPSVQIGSSTSSLRLAINSVTPGAGVVIDTAGGGDIDVYAAGHAMQVAYDRAYGHLGSNGTGVLNLSTVYDASKADGIAYLTGVNALFGADVILDAKNIVISVDGRGVKEARGLSLGSDSDGIDYRQTTVRIGSENTENLTIVANGADNSMGVFALRSDTLIQAKNVSISTDAEGGYGVLVQNSTQFQDAPQNRARLVIDADNTVINTPNGGGLMAFSNGYLEVNGNLTVNARNAIDVRGHSLTNINQDGTGTVILNGNIAFETPGPEQQSGDILDATVNLNLNGQGSRWTGNVYRQYPKSQEGNEDLNGVHGLNVTLANGAQWNPTIIQNQSDDTGYLEGIALNHLEFEDGVINLENTGHTVEVESMSGTGGTVNVATSANNGGGFTTATLTVGSVDSTAGTLPSLAVKYTGINADDLTNPEADMKTLGEQSIKLTEGEHIAQVRTVEEGDIRGSVTQTVDEDGKVTGTTTAANVKLADYSSLNAMSLVQWRNEINHLTKRLGDIRAAEGTIGAWARVYGGESQWGGGNEVEMDHTTIQVGGDYRVNNHWIVGGAFSYTDSDADLAKGAATGDSYSLAAYATYMADGGSFLDLIARYGYLKNDIDSGNMSLETGSSAFSLTAEIGHTFRFMEERAYIEPQVEFTYGFVSGDDDTASNGVKIEQDDFQSFVTRVGVRTGFDFPKKAGTIYGMVSYSYDFLGDADGMASEGNLRQALSEDLGGGWVSYGIGAQVMFGKSSYFYGELERTSGGEVDNPYLFNAGVRITF